MKKTVLVASAVCLIAFVWPAHAQWVVIDPTNLTQNILTAARTLEQINNQIRQLQNEAQMLIHGARNLASLDVSVLSQLRASLAATNQLIQQAQGLAFNVSQMETSFARLYPAAYGSSISGVQMAGDARQRWQASLEALRTATQLQSQAVQNFTVDEQSLTDLVNRSQAAVGALQAAQSTNQLLALQARQAIQAQQLQVTQDRAVALEQARLVAVQERAREVRRRFQGNGTTYTPYAVNFITSKEAAMKTIPICVAVLLVSACSNPDSSSAAVESVEVLVANPDRLKDLRAQCKANHAKVGDAQCNAVAEATRRRFMKSGTSPKPATTASNVSSTSSTSSSAAP